MSRPANILLIHSHDCGRAIQPYGWPVATPHMLAFARQGVLFRHAHCTAPTCGRSRASLMTRQYPHQCGMFGLPGCAGWKLHEISCHLVHVLNAVSYLTVPAGAQHEVNHADLSPLQYQRLLDTRPQKRRAPSGEAEPRGGISHGAHRPSFLSFVRYGRTPPPWLPDHPELRKDAETFNEGVRILDEYVGSPARRLQ